MYDSVDITAENIQKIFRHAADFVLRPVQVGALTLTACFIDGLTSGSDIADFVLRPISDLREQTPRALLRRCLDGTVYTAVADGCRSMDEVCQKLTNGFCVVIFPTIPDQAVAFEVKTAEQRSPSPPQVENTVKGAKDAFTENSRTNTSLIRRHLRTAELAIWESTVGRRSHTNVSVLSLRGLTDPQLTEQIIRRMESIDIDGMLTPAAVEEYLTGSRRTAFPLLQYTERTDRFAQGLLDGQVGILVDGLPLGYLAPVNVGRLMTSPEDRGTDYVTASGVRVIRYGALLISLLLPALYVAMAQFHPAMIPTLLLRAIIESKERVPFPTILEIMGLLVSFELLQEAGLHLPQSIGHTVSIIGGLVVGTAAVEARLISPAALIVVSVAGICGFAVPGQDFSNAVRIWRFGLTVCAALAGLFGLTVGGIVLLIRLGALESCGRPYLAPFSAVTAGGAVFRRRLVTQKYRDPSLRTQDRRNQR